jgi:hexosaminidase
MQFADTPIRDSGTMGTVMIPPDVPARFGLRFTGYLRVPADGVYTFHLVSDDGSRLWIGDQTVIDFDGPHTVGEARGQAALKRGLHRITVQYFQGGGGMALQLWVSGKGLQRARLDREWLFHQ